jgi:hypothetical protein
LVSRRLWNNGTLLSGIDMQTVDEPNAATASPIKFEGAAGSCPQGIKGQAATAREIKARWAFSEVLSDRFGGVYATVLASPLHDQIKRGCKFSDIPQEGWGSLVEGLNQARNPEFTAIVDAFGLNGYVCAEWSVEDLMNAKVLPVFGQGLSYRQFLTMFPMSRSTGAIDPRDPRFKAWETPIKRAPFVQAEPLIAINVGSEHMLVEGYARSILWVRSAARSLLMWVPA